MLFGMVHWFVSFFFIMWMTCVRMLILSVTMFSFYLFLFVLSQRTFSVLFSEALIASVYFTFKST